MKCNHVHPNLWYMNKKSSIEKKRNWRNCPPPKARWGGGAEWPTIAQNLKSICFQAFLGAFLPQVQGSWWILCPEGSEFVWQKGCRESKMPDYGRLLISPFPIAGNWLKVAITRHFWLPAPLCHTYSEPSGHEDSLGPPVPGAKMHPEMPGNKYLSSFGQLWVIQSPFRLKRVRLGTKISTDGWSSYEHSQELDCVVFVHCIMT